MQKILIRFIVLSFSLLIISCTADSEKIVKPNKSIAFNDSPRPKTAKTNTDSPVSLKPLHLGFSQWPGYAPWQLAEEKDIFEKNNLNIDLQFSDYSQSLNSMTKGEIDVNSQTLGDTITTLANNPQSEQVVIAYLDYSNGADQIIVSKAINSLADLSGKKVAVELGTTTHLLLLLGLQAAGVDPNKITIVNLGLQAGAAAFIEEEVEAIATFSPFSNVALKRPGSKAILT
ncbi:MAG: ABC transporter substrate-binding protein, partial [Microcoleaceae cyanobacterium]